MLPLTSLPVLLRWATSARSVSRRALASVWWAEMASSNWACRAFSSEATVLMVAWGVQQAVWGQGPPHVGAAGGPLWPLHTVLGQLDSSLRRREAGLPLWLTRCWVLRGHSGEGRGGVVGGRGPMWIPRKS